MRNAGDAKQVERAGEKETRRHEREAADLTAVMSTPAGRRFIWRLMRTANPGVQFTPDARYQDFLLGNANVATWLEADIERVCPALYDLMRQEARKRTETDYVD
ncbi:MAG TPA: hypothetical protein VNK91_01910 [Burkholderiaceae bacterium]|nr:hypothetical protein [Burkholderiaceae bacterium]